MKGDIFHVVNRGIEKGKIFNCSGDYLRFICNLYKFNNKDSALRLDVNTCFDSPPEQDKIIDILSWSLIPNHYHLLIHERVDGGVVEFIKRVGNGYTKYFNIKNNRSGYLFQNSAKIIPVQTNEHFLYLPFYIDSNPVDLIEPDWKDEGIKNIKNVMNFLESYKWSSFRDCMNINNFPYISNRELFFELFETDQKQYKNDFMEWLQDVNLPR